MSALTLFFIMKLDTIGSMLFWGALLYFGYLFWEYAGIWWSTPAEDTSIWGAFLSRKRKRATLASVVMLVAMVMPSTKDAVIMTAVPAIVRHSIWDRLFVGGMPRDVVENAQKLIKNSDR